MYTVVTPAGFSFTCLELDDAVVLADNLHGDLGETVVVLDKTGEVVYSTGE